MNASEAKTIYFPNMAAKVILPVLPEDERTKRTATIHRQAASLLKKEK